MGRSERVSDTVRPSIRRAIAYHEAGHAYMAWSVGFAVNSMRLEARSGDTDVDYDPKADTEISGMLGRCMVAAAGHEGERLVGTPRLEHHEDLLRIYELAALMRFVDREALVTWLKCETRARIANDRGAVDALASALLETEFIDGSRVREILATASNVRSLGLPGEK